MSSYTPILVIVQQSSSYSYILAVIDIVSGLLKVYRSIGAHIIKSRSI